MEISHDMIRLLKKMALHESSFSEPNIPWLFCFNIDFDLWCTLTFELKLFFSLYRIRHISLFLKHSYEISFHDDTS